MTWKERVRQIADGMRMAWKRALSYFRRSWKFSDYPIRVRVQSDVLPDARYWARVLGWNLDGLGSTRDDAMRALEQVFETRKAALTEKGKPLPRPGRRAPVRFAPQERVLAHGDLAEDFIQRVLGLEWAWISDESSLGDFHNEQTNATLCAQIRAAYGVDASDIESGNIADILDRIANKPIGRDSRR
jgi:predicted RNase H-like HicB family nuclease